MESKIDPLKQPDFRQEYRLGLVVYGGISLAIYMNGVCREFYNAVRGRGIYKLVKALTDSDIIVDVISGTSAGGINGVLLSYALTNSDKDTAVDFKNFAQIWRESGDIGELLRKAEPKLKSPDPEHPTNSVLDGEGYYQDRLAEAFQQASNKKDKQPQKDANEWFSDSSELDLFVTGTDTLGRISKAFDNTGSVIEIKDHKTVFLLKHRRNRKHPFQEQKQTWDSLAKLCRITSCFPVAFPVVKVEIPPPHPGQDDAQAISKIEAIDQRLAYWGNLSNRELPSNTPPHGYNLYFVDGGVLDNRPFSYTIREMYNRVAYRPVERRLFYIDPSPDQFLGSLKFNQMPEPSVWQTVSDSLVGMPRYESISGDLQEIKERNKRVLRYKFLRATAERVGIDKKDSLEAAKQQGQPTPQPDSRQELYLRCRLVGMRDRILPLILRIDQSSTDLNKQTLLETAAQLLTRYITDPDKQQTREEILNRLGKQIRNLDVDYALRKHFFLLEKICQDMADPKYQAEAAYNTLKELAGKVGLQIALLEIIQAALVGMLQSEPVSQAFYALMEQAEVNPEMAREQTYQYLLGLHRFLLDTKELPEFIPPPSEQRTTNLDALDRQEDLVEIPADFFNRLPDGLSDADPKQVSDKLSSVYAQLKQRAEQLSKPDPAQPGIDLVTPELLSQNQSPYNLEARFEQQPDFENNDAATYCSILFKVEQETERLIKDGGVSLSSDLLKQFQSFRYIEEEVYSYEYLADIQAKSQIEIIQISPDAAQFGFGKGKGLADKLAGDQLNAFGGFFKKSWRSNDILWGRLDGLNRIVEALLTPEAIKNFPDFVSRQLGPIKGESTTDKTTNYLNLLVTEALPDATPDEKVLLLKGLRKLAAGQPLPDRDQFLDAMVTAGHRAILKTDLGNVLEDAMAEQIDWNHQLVTSKRSFQKIISNLGYETAFPNAPTNPGDQTLALRQVDQLVAGLLISNPRQRQKFLQQNPPPALPEGAFGQFKQLNPTGWEQLNQSFQALTAPTFSVDQLYEFLNRLSVAVQTEKTRSVDQAIGHDIDQLNEQLEPLLQKLKPKYEPVSGYFDRTITPFAVKELAVAPVAALLKDPRQVDDYFRNIYRVGSEKLSENVPTIVLEDIAARAGLVLRDIVNSPPTGDTVRKTTLFQIVNRTLQSFHFWVSSTNPKTSGILSGLRNIPALLWQIAVVGVIAFLVSRLPELLLVLIVTLAILQLLKSLLIRKEFPFRIRLLLLATTAAFLLIVGPHFLPAGSIDWAVPLSKLRISIQNR